MPASTQRMRKPKKICQYIIHTCFSSQLFLPSFAYSKFDIIKIRLIFLPVIFHLALPNTGRKQPPQTNKDLIRTIEKLQELKKPVYRHCLEVFTHLQLLIFFRPSHGTPCRAILAMCPYDTMLVLTTIRLISPHNQYSLILTPTPLHQAVYFRVPFWEKLKEELMNLNKGNCKVYNLATCLYVSLLFHG